MKNSEIHKGLDKEVVRDFLGQSLMLSLHNQSQNKKEVIPYNQNLDDIFKWKIQDNNAQIEFLKRDNDLSTQIIGALALIKNSGWEEFDVSDFVHKDITYGYMSFIGTKEEHANFLKQLEK